jgi:hypothetical protein
MTGAKRGAITVASVRKKAMKRAVMRRRSDV